MRIGEVWELIDVEKYEFFVRNKWNPAKIVGIGDKGKRQAQIDYNDYVTIEGSGKQKILTIYRPTFLKMYQPKR